MKRKPVHILTGFLGAGKTTFLNHFIKTQLPERILVIENECGDTNVDGGLIMEEAEEVIELSAGCLCCSLADGLLDILEEASQRSDQYDRLVIETTGIADPSSILQVFLEDPRVERAFDLQQVICLVDAAEVEGWLQQTEEALRQISVADVLLINKIDRVTPEQLEKTVSVVEGVNGLAKVLCGKQGVFPLQTILETGITKPAYVEERTQQHHHHHEVATKSTNQHKITTFTLTFSGPVDLNHLLEDLNQVVQLHRDQVYRVKGVIALPHYPNRVILQSAKSTFVATDGSPWEEESNREGRLVFIGRGLQREALKRLLQRHAIVH